MALAYECKNYPLSFFRQRLRTFSMRAATIKKRKIMFGFKSKAEKEKEAGFEFVKKGRLLLPKIIPSLSVVKYTDFYIFSWGYYEMMLNNFDIDNKTFQDFYSGSMLDYSTHVVVDTNKYITAFGEVNNILNLGLDNLKDEEELMQLGAQLCSPLDASSFSRLATLLKTRFANE